MADLHPLVRRRDGQMSRTQKNVLCLAGFLAVVLAWPAGVFAQQPALDLASPSAILIDALSGQVLYEKNADERNAPASLTKIMTLLLAVEAIEAGRLGLQDIVVASEHAESYGGTEIWLETGEEMTVEHILLAIAVASANDASVAIAEHLAGSEAEFVELMNQRARELGMTRTNFGNSHGLDDPDHYTTARDMATLSREAVRHPLLLKYTAIYDTYIRENKTWLVNRNRMVTFYQGCDGLKTGWTQEAGYSVSVTAQRGGTRFIAVVMGAAAAADRFSDTTKMLNWAFARYSSLLVAERGQSYGTVPVNLGSCPTVEAVAPETGGVLLEKGSEAEVTREVSLLPVVEAPVRRGDPLGAIVVRQGDREIGRCLLVAERDVGRIGCFRLVWRLFLRVLTGS